MTIIIFVIVLAVLIFVHELGHFLAARACGVRVDKFKIGFGPKIFAWKNGETEYGVNAVPFGGYVKIFGEDPNAESTEGPDSKRSFVNKPRWQQAIVLFAGVFFNFLFAWLLYSVIFTAGTTVATDGFEKYADRFGDQRIMITYLEPGSPAERAGLEVRDTIQNIGGNEAVSGSEAPLKIETVQEVINSSGANPVELEYLRNGDPNTTEIIPAQGIVENKYAIGIAMQNTANLKLPVFMAIYEGAHYTVVLTKETAIALYGFVANIFKGQADFSDVAGPIGIVGIVGNAAELGFTYLLMIMAIISINLGIINLIPFPALDGGRILFVAIEGVVRRRIPVKFFNIVNTVGFALLMALMVAVTYKDVLKLVK